MSFLAKRLSWLVLGTFSFLGLAAAATLTVRYKPYGVPDSRREEYEAKFAQLRQHAELLQEVSEEVRPIVVVPETRHDFGMLDPHTTASHTFLIRNEGDDPLALDVRETSCKCTLGELRDKLLAPGGETSVTLTWNTGYQAERYEQTATIETNDPLSREITLAVAGTVRAQFVCPEKIVFKKCDLNEPAATSFVVYSQLWESFDVVELDCDLEGFEWHAEPIEVTTVVLADTQTRSAWRVHAQVIRSDYGPFTAEVQLRAVPSDGSEEVERELAASGRVRSPINFYSPSIHVSEGLDIGTVVAGKQHTHRLVVRARGDLARRSIDVLDIQPAELQATLTPMSTAGSYQLTITVPADCPRVIFNTDHKRGYVQVGDPQDKDYSNWFPLIGAVVTLAQ